MPDEKDIALLQDMFAPEELDEDLVPYVTQGRLGMAIFHPYVHDPFYTPLKNKMTNKMFRQKKEAVERAIAEGNWRSYVIMHERPYRLEALEAILYEHEIDDPTIIWPLVASIWTDSENICQNLDQWLDVWDQSLANRHELVMTDDERAALIALSDEIVIYRGVSHPDAVGGLSWTMDRTKAEWFAHRASRLQGGKPLLATGKILKSSALAHFLGRGETEIVCLPEDVMEVTTIKLRAQRPITKTITIKGK